MEEIAVSVCISRRAGLFDRYETALKLAGIPLHVEPLPESLPNGNLGDLEMSLRIKRTILGKLHNYRRVVLTDGWDMLFYGTREELISKIPDSPTFGAERVCWPEPNRANDYPDPGTIWRYVNGGGMAGTREALMAWTDAMEEYLPEHGTEVDQRLFNRLLLKRSPLVSVDSKTDLFYCMTREKGELQNHDGRPVNTVTKTQPNFIHFCAKTDPTPFFKIMGEA